MTTYTQLPHQKLVAWQVAVRSLVTLKKAHIRDPKLRDQAERAAKSICLNIAEANGRQSTADRKRVFSIARGELAEAAGALEIAALVGDCDAVIAAEGAALALRVHALLTALINR